MTDAEWEEILAYIKGEAAKHTNPLRHATQGVDVDDLFRATPKPAKKENRK